MQKKILLAVDDSSPSKRLLQYAVTMSSVITNLHVVLFHIQPLISLFLQEEAKKKAGAKKELDRIIEKNKAAARALLDDYKAILTDRGISAERIECITRTRNLGYAKDIIECAQTKLYDAILVGRRGVSGIQKMYSGSVTSDILEQSQVIPVWLVDGDVPQGDILIAFDGSEAGLRAVDHAGFILGNNPGINLTLLHVSTTAENYCEIDLEKEPNAALEAIVARGDKTLMDRFCPKALNALKDAGIPEHRIRIETLTGKRRVGKAIMEFAQKGHFSTLVIGRRGVNKSFFMGSASRYIINKLSDRALWVVP